MATIRVKPARGRRTRTEAIGRGLLLAALLLTLTAPAQAHEIAPLYPVWWSDELELESLDRVNQRLRRDFWPGIGEGFDLYVGIKPKLRKAYARNCESLVRLSEAGYSALGNINIKPQIFNLAFCRAIAMLAKAKAARVSYLRDFVLNAEALDYLPPLVNLYPSCELICYAVEANERGIPYSTFETALGVEVKSDEEMLVLTTSWKVIFTIVGRGDFTGNGVDDMLLLANGHATEGTYGSTRLYLMTRDTPGAVLRVIDAKQELCLDYACRPLPHDIKSYRGISAEPRSD